MDDFIQRQGPAYLAHILRRLADELVRGAAEWYPEAGVSAPPRTTSTLLALDEHGPLGVTELSALLRQSHPLVIDWRRQLADLGFVETELDPKDGRRSVLVLTTEGRREVRRLRRALAVMEKASRRLMEQAGPGLFAALWRMDDALDRQPFVERLRDHAARAKAGQDKSG
jgi:MarR family transcriptional regulator, organic hydroperoxide resistance regulator